MAMHLLATALVGRQLLCHNAQGRTLWKKRNMEAVQQRLCMDTMESMQSAYQGEPLVF